MSLGIGTDIGTEMLRSQPHLQAREGGYLPVTLVPVVVSELHGAGHRNSRSNSVHELRGL